MKVEVAEEYFVYIYF